MSVAPWDCDVNLTDFLVYRHIRDGRGEHPALLFGSNIISYLQLALDIGSVVERLRARRIRPGDRVAILLPDSPSFAASFFATLQLGGVAVPVNPLTDSDDLQHILYTSDARLLITCSDLIACLQMVSDIPSVELLELEFTSVQALDTTVYKLASQSAYCLFSSGTTGKPKGILHTHTDILECIHAYSKIILGMTAEDRILAVPKLTFGYGLGGNLLSSLYFGATAILFPDSVCFESLIRVAQLTLPTLFLGQPRMIAALLANFDDIEGFDELRLAVSAGEVLSQDLLRWWNERFKIPLLDGFGTTEVGHVFITNRLGDIKPGCAGRVVEGYSVKILDDYEQPVEKNVVGNLWVSGPSLTEGYLQDPESTAHRFKNGYVCTGDLFREDEEGYFYVCGRADEMIKAGCGQWVSPNEIENIIIKDEQVRECAVVGYSDRLGLVKPKAFVVLSKSAFPSKSIEQRLMESVASCFPDLPHKHLGHIEFISELPRTASGKLQRFKLQSVSLTEFSYQC
jgi:acyl-coenzyme A synthetase/AMP-(fatty) acid ligase